jgi:hypothetical protein
MKRRLDKEGIASELAGLSSLGRQQLLDKWRTIYGTEPPYKIRNNFLIRAIAYRMQEQAMGGLKPVTRRFLEKILQDDANGRKTSVPTARAKPGTRLLREWHGTTHEVLILEDSIIFKGKKYKSLSEVARHITGTKWSGPLFFGLKKKAAA